MSNYSTYSPFSSFLLRTPYFSFNKLGSFSEFEKSPIFKEMLQIASPSLSRSIDKGDVTSKYSCYRYFQRACTRPTPFGLFAGCSIGTIGEKTKIFLSDQNRYQRCTRLDMNYICALTQQIERDNNIRKQLIYFPNTSIYLAGENLRYIEYYYQKTRRIHQITAVGNSDYLQRILSLAEKGALFTTLASILVDDEIDYEEATEFIHELIDSQILVSELEPAITNVDPLSVLIAKLELLKSIESDVISTLKLIHRQISEIDNKPIGTTNEIYPQIISNIKLTKVEAEIKYLFQTDMFKPTQHAEVSQNIINDIRNAIIFLNKITSPNPKTILSQFKENFIKRYEEREMPLLFVLDNELGIGYVQNRYSDISPLVDDLFLPSNPSSNIVMSPFQSLMLQRYQKALYKNEQEIVLTDADVKDLAPDWTDLPDTISVMCQILNDDTNGRSIYIKSVVGQSAANLLGRFCHLDEHILRHTLKIIEKETHNNPNVIFAEIVHLPESRIGNILLRPVLRPYEIPYLAKSGVPKEFEIKLSDLYLSVKNNNFVLRSKSLNKYVIPRMSTAHNYRYNSMPIYHFLCDMQHQNGRDGLGFYWGDVATKFNFLHRVTYKNCILSPATWTVQKKEIEPFMITKSDDELLDKINEWLSSRNIPNEVLLSDGDNELYVNMNNPLSLRAWMSIVKNRQSFLLEEMLFNSDTAIVHGQDEIFTNEFLFSFYKTS